MLSGVHSCKDWHKCRQQKSRVRFFLNTDDLELEEENHRLGKNAKEKGKKMDTVF